MTMTYRHSTVALLLMLLLLIVGEGSALAQGDGLSTDRIRFGAVRIDSCRRDSLVLSPAGKKRILVVAIKYVPQSGELSHTNISVPDTIDAPRTIYLTYCPHDTLGDTVRLILMVSDSSTVSSDTVLITGTGTKDTKPAIPVIRFDSASRRGISVVDFGRARPGGSRGALVELVNVGNDAASGVLSIRGSGAFTLDSVRRRSSGFGPPRGTVDTVRVGDSLGLALRFLPTRIGADSADLVFETPSGPRILTLRGNGIGAVARMPDTLAAGILGRDSCWEFELPIANDGNEPLVIDAFRLDTSRIRPLFRLDSLPDTIPAGSSAVYGFRFCPGARGSVASAIEVVTNAAAGRSRVMVTARVIAGRLLADQVPYFQVAGGCDTMTVVIRNLGDDATSATVVGLSQGDRGFVLIDGEQTRMLKVEETMTVRVLFCASSLSLMTDTLIVVDGAGERLEVPLGARGVSAEMIALRLPSDGVPLARYDFGDVPTGSARSIVVFVRNRGTVPIAIPVANLTATLLPSSAGGSFSVAPARAGVVRLELPPDQLDSIRVTYRPGPLGVDSALVIVGGIATLDAQRSAPTVTRIVLLGRSVPAAVEGRKLRLQPASGHVGDTLYLAVRATPPVAASEGLDHIEITFHVDRGSLAPVTGGDPFVRLTANNGVWTWRRDGLLTGDTIALIRLVALSTAVPESHAAIESATIGTRAVDHGNDSATITLEGCGLGLGPSFGTKVSIAGLMISGGSGVANITYLAPEGERPEVRIVDLEGTLRLATELPAGIGVEQTGAVPLRGLSAGVYLLELRLGGDRSFIPIMIAR